MAIGYTVISTIALHVLIVDIIAPKTQSAIATHAGARSLVHAV